MSAQAEFLKGYLAEHHGAGPCGYAPREHAGAFRDGINAPRSLELDDVAEDWLRDGALPGFWPQVWSD